MDNVNKGAGIFLVIPGPPVGKGRARFARAGKFIRAYPHPPTARMEELIKLVFYEKYPDWTPISEGITVSVRAYFPIPKSTSKKRAEQMASDLFPYTSAPDADNILKILDALNGIAFTDDRLIYSAEVCKYYSLRPRLEIDIYEKGVL